METPFNPNWIDDLGIDADSIFSFPPLDDEAFAAAEAERAVAALAHNAAVLVEVNARLDAAYFAEVRPTTLECFAGAVPFQAWGRAGEEWFYFRFRGDHATLKVGTRHPEGVVDVCRLSASRRAVTGDWLNGVLSDAEATDLFTELWLELADPEQ